MRVLIIDDHKLFAEALRSVLDRDGLEVRPVTTSAREGLEAARSSRPDLVLVDIGLPDAGGVEVGRQLLDELPDTKVVAVTGLSDAELLREAVKAGFHGYLTKDTSISRFGDAIKAVMGGQLIMPHRLGAAAAGARSGDEHDARLLAEQLTARELRVLGLLVEGESSDQIAQRLSISPNTVRTHIQNVLTKLQVHSRLEAAAFAVRHGLVDTGRPRRRA
jgi:two-component system, NarL family, nitrate/nitrite response regulator NarL